MAQQNQQRRDREPRAPKEFEEKVIEIKRVTQKKKGGNKISFSALVVIGDRKGRAAVGFNKAPDVMSAIQKSIGRAKKHLVTIKRVGADTIPHEILFKYKSAAILLKPAPEGTGVIAGGPIRSVLEAFGIRNLVSKMMGSNNKTLNVYATFMALEALKTQEVSSMKQEVRDEVKIVNTGTKPIVKADTSPLVKEGTQPEASGEILQEDQKSNIKAQNQINKPKKETKKTEKTEVKKPAVKKSTVKTVKKTNKKENK